MPNLMIGLFLAATPATATSTNLTWLIARDLGLLTFLLATASVLLGLSTSTRTGDRTLGRGAVYDSHRALALLTVTSLAGHILFLALDSYAQFSITSLVIPFTIWYRPVWSSLGIVAAYLLGAIYLSFYIRARIGYRTWRTLHYATFAVFVLATVHGFMAGTDSGASWSILLYVAAVGAVAAMMTYRLLRGANVSPRWAWLPDFGDEGAARLALALGTVLVAFTLTGVVLLTSGTRPTTAATDSARDAAAPAASAPPSRTDPATLPDANQPALQRRSGNALFSGAMDGDSWRLVSSSLAGAELDLPSSGLLALVRVDSGQVLFESSTPVSVGDGSGSIQAILDGAGQYAGGRMVIDGSYQVEAGQLRIAARVELDTPVTR